MIRENNKKTILVIEQKKKTIFSPKNFDLFWLNILYKSLVNNFVYNWLSNIFIYCEQLPPQLNLARSQLQCYGEMMYSFDGPDLLGECGRGDQPIERLKSMVTWYISTLRPLIFGMAPYNPIIGETHHVSNGHINVLIEQASLLNFPIIPLKLITYIYLLLYILKILII